MKKIGLFLLVLSVLLWVGTSYGCSGDVTASVTYRYEWDTPQGGVTFKTGTGTWKGSIEVYHLWDILEDKPFWMTMDLDVHSDIPYIDGDAKSWLFFSCSSMIKETETKVQKIRFFCTGYPYWPWGSKEIFYLVPLSLTGTLIPVGSDDDLRFRLDATLQGLSQGIYFFKANMKGWIYPGWDD